MGKGLLWQRPANSENQTFLKKLLNACVLTRQKLEVKKTLKPAHTSK